MVIENQFFENNLIKIGENKDDNDIIISQAKQTDLWFHLANLPSCHVVLSCDKKNPPTKKMIKLCAELCKNHTKFKKCYKVKVNYTEIRNIRKTKEKGKVIIKGKTRTILV